jgi:hypothetical protein
MVEDGIASDAIRKEVSKDDVANDDADAAALFGMYGTKQKVKMGKILIGRRMSIQKMQFRCTPRGTT